MQKPDKYGKVRINVPLTEEAHELLRKLAFHCKTSKTELTARIVHEFLTNEDWVKKVKEDDE